MTDTAQQLWQARCEGRVISPVSFASEDAAYEAQGQLSECSTSKVCGYKIGATLPPALELLNLSEPFFGPLFDSHCKTNGSDIALAPVQKNMLETEFAVGLTSDLPAQTAEYSLEDAMNAVGWVAGAFEIVGIRFDTEFKGAGRMFIADSGANVDFVMGDKYEDWRSLDLSCHPASLAINGEEVASGHSGMSIWEHTIGPVAWLANHRVMKTRGLKAGDIITTGSCTGMKPVAPGDEASADFGPLGQVNVKFTAI